MRVYTSSLCQLRWTTPRGLIEVAGSSTRLTYPAKPESSQFPRPCEYNVKIHQPPCFFRSTFNITFYPIWRGPPTDMPTYELRSTNLVWSPLNCTSSEEYHLRWTVYQPRGTLCSSREEHRSRRTVTVNTTGQESHRTLTVTNFAQTELCFTSIFFLFLLQIIDIVFSLYGS